MVVFGHPRLRLVYRLCPLRVPARPLLPKHFDDGNRFKVFRTFRILTMGRRGANTAVVALMLASGVLAGCTTVQEASPSSWTYSLPHGTVWYSEAGTEPFPMNLEGKPRQLRHPDGTWDAYRMSYGSTSYFASAATLELVGQSATADGKRVYSWVDCDVPALLFRLGNTEWRAGGVLRFSSRTCSMHATMISIDFIHVDYTLAWQNDTGPGYSMDLWMDGSSVWPERIDHMEVETSGNATLLMSVERTEMEIRGYITVKPTTGNLVDEDHRRPRTNGPTASGGSIIDEAIVVASAQLPEVRSVLDRDPDAFVSALHWTHHPVEEEDESPFIGSDRLTIDLKGPSQGVRFEYHRKLLPEPLGMYEETTTYVGDIGGSPIPPPGLPMIDITWAAARCQHFVGENQRWQLGYHEGDVGPGYSTGSDGRTIRVGIVDCHDLAGNFHAAWDLYTAAPSEWILLA